MEEHADAGEPDLLGIAKLPVNRDRIEGVGLPHLQLIDGGAGAEIAADQPGLLGVPGVGLVRRPRPREIRGLESRARVTSTRALAPQR